VALAGCVRIDHRPGIGPAGAAARRVGERSLAGVGRNEQAVGRHIVAGRSVAAARMYWSALDLQNRLQGRTHRCAWAAQHIPLPTKCVSCRKSQLTSGG
jgi:hypothetical protein